MFYEIVSSSSAGNFYVYNKDLAVDMGVSFSKVKPYIKDLKLVLLSHEHS